MPNANSAIVHRWFQELWNEGNMNIIDELASPDAIGYGQIEQDGRIDMEQFRALFLSLRSAFPDIKFTIEQTVAEGDMVVVRWRAAATHRGEFLGTKPTNRSVEFTGMSMQRIVNGKIIQGWDNWDQLGLLTQIDAAPAKRFLEPQPQKAAS
jgi:predicted ester cyclase